MKHVALYFIPFCSVGIIYFSVAISFFHTAFEIYLIFFFWICSFLAFHLFSSATFMFLFLSSFYSVCYFSIYQMLKNVI